MDGGYTNNGANNWTAVRDTYTQWGWVLRETLLALRSKPPLPPPLP